MQSSGRRRWFLSQRHHNEIIYLKAWSKVVFCFVFLNQCMVTKICNVDYTMAFRVKIFGF